MSTLTVFLGFSLLATSALADELVANPTYLGGRFANPEQETYGSPADSARFARTLAFIGPARSVGPVSGEPEKDTVGYIPLLVNREAVQAGRGHERV
jgi:hypothetical protein